MRTTHNVKRLTALAAAACGVAALTACSSGGSNDAATSSTLPTSSSSSATTSSAAPTSSSTAASSSDSSSAGSSSSSAGSASPSASSSSSAAATSSSPSVKVDPVGACTTATQKTNDAATKWNNAVDTQVSTQLDSAAANFRSTAKELRGLAPQAGDAGFEKRISYVVRDMEKMAQARTNRQTVDTQWFNRDSKGLRTYCQGLITK
ncbi:hypothetical protein [Flexivirga meconopsidis]|jgi:hypothetical protein|uniref:hypothetical protein n=1 Tax=Flexivirga meconopsidis TaxID=2977121 RepID=UPI00223ED9D9|nr:hypothetical protein [Flexivirga meconopsidis]